MKQSDRVSTKTERKRIRTIGKRWYNVLALYEWDLTTKFVDGALIVDGSLDQRAAGCASVDWEYRRAVIQFNVQQTALMTDIELENTYVHEIMHVLLHEMREDGIKHEERTASTLAFAFLRAIKR